MSDEEKKFQELCEYVRTEIMGYDDNQMLTKQMILRLRGAKEGKYVANKSVSALANYPYEIILLTFKYIKPRLADIFRTKNFNSETHKFNYVMIVMNNNLNLVYNKVKKVKEEQKKIDNITVEDIPNYDNKYISNNTSVNKNLESFW